MIKSPINPDLYHGHHKRKDFFEGWYFKIVDPSLEHIYAIIPGIFLGNTTQYNSHSFIQILDGTNRHFFYQKYPTTSFSAAQKTFFIDIENNQFSLNIMNINLQNSNISICGTLRFDKIKKWPDSLLHPGSMGIYNYFSFMECYSQVCVMDMRIDGELDINGKNIDFTGGRAYVEKNWGRQFPKGWVWIQSNHFQKSQASISCSVGHIPFIYKTFRGFLIGLWLNNTFYRFTTMNKSIIEIEKNGTDILITAQNKKHILTIKTETSKESFILCHGPDGNNMTPFVQENLTGIIQVILKDHKRNKIIFSDVGRCAGIEYGGNQRLMI